MYYLNTNVPARLFEKVKNSPVYADKTLLLEKISGQINTAGQCICITRPRRFGKTVNASMLGAYYTKGQDSGELFRGTYIEKTAGFQIHRNKYNVVYIDFSQTSDFCPGYREYLTEILEKLKSDLSEGYPGLRGRTYSSVSQMFRDTEVRSGKGYCDYLFLPKHSDSPAFILELKVDSSCEEAIAQIQSRNYVQKAEAYKSILLVGINYDRKTKKHTCRIVKFK